MPRYVFSPDDIASTGQPQRLEFYDRAEGGHRLTDLYTIDEDDNTVDAIPQGVVLTNALGADIADFAGPDDVSVLYMSVNGSSSRTAIEAARMTEAQGDLTGTYAPITGSIAYAPILRAALGNECVFLGNSMTLGADTGSINKNWGDSWSTYASLQSGGRIRKVRNAGVAGNTTAQMLARFDTDVTPYAPNVVFLQEVTNDTGNAVPLATSAANYRALVAKCAAIHAVPVLVTGAPVGPAVAPTATRQRDVTRLNQWLTRYAADNGIHIIDFYSLLVDPATGGLQSAYDSGDNIHPNATGYAAMGALVATAAASIFPAWTPPLVGFNTEPEAGPLNGMFLLDTNTDGVPNSWTATGSATGATHTIEVDAAVPGSMAKIAQSANAGIRYLYSGGIPGTYAAGHVLGFGAVVTSDGGVNCNIQVQFFTAGSVLIEAVTHQFTKPVTRGVFWTEMTCPATTGLVAISLVAGAGTGNIQWGRVTVRNLTLSGVLAA